MTETHEPLEMNEEIRAQWVTALTSGEYIKGTGALHSIAANAREGTSRDRWCCLGVLCDLAVKAGVPMMVVELGKEGPKRFDGQMSFLPEVVRKWAGLASSDPFVYGQSLSSHNDGSGGEGKGSKGSRFSTIAAMIAGTRKGR